ncbi:MAG: TonB family protein [Candidatus Sulfotelmatobacter sp.]
MGSVTEVEVQPAATSPPSAAVPSFLVELDSWPRVFFGNVWDLIFRRRPALHLESAPAAFWPDVFVQRRLPWWRFLESLGYHALALALLVSFSHFSWLHPLPQPRPAFDRAQVISYEPVEYLPPVDTRRPEAARPRKADPELAQQPIISLPPEADNRLQTIVTAPVVKLKRDVALPNIVAWPNQDSSRPQLAIAPPPVVLASSITRIAPKVTNSVVAPPPDLRAAPRNASPQAPQAAIIEPPPEIERSSVRTAGALNIAHAAVIAPAPQLSVSEQRAYSGTAVTGAVAQVVPPPPAWAASGYSAAGSRVIALNLHPAVGAPPDPPSGNRRGTFAATPEGHRGASGSPGVSGNVGNAADHGSGNKENGKSALPAELYVGKATNAKTSSVAGNPAGRNSFPANSVNPRLLARLSPPSANVSPHSAQPESAKLSEAERAVFGDRKFYSLALNMPNLNSAGGSWIVRFAEINQDSSADSAGLAAPTAIRKVDPAYPLQLMRENVEGTVIVYAVIHADGSVGAVRILRGIDDRIDPFASQAISQWQFRPATKNGAPVAVEATFLIPFRSGRVGSSF